MGDCPFFWNLALPNQRLGRNPGFTNPFNGKRHRQGKATPNTVTLQPFSSPLSSLYITSLKLFNLNHRKRNSWKHKSLRRRNNNLGMSTLGAICGHLTRFSYTPSNTLAFICHELHKCTLINKNELLFLHISTLKYIWRKSNSLLTMRAHLCSSWHMNASVLEGMYENLVKYPQIAPKVDAPKLSPQRWVDLPF